MYSDANKGECNCKHVRSLGIDGDRGKIVSEREYPMKTTSNHLSMVLLIGRSVYTKNPRTNSPRLCEKGPVNLAALSHDVISLCLSHDVPHTLFLCRCWRDVFPCADPGSTSKKLIPCNFPNNNDNKSQYFGVIETRYRIYSDSGSLTIEATINVQLTGDWKIDCNDFIVDAWILAFFKEFFTISVVGIYGTFAQPWYCNKK